MTLAKQGMTAQRLGTRLGNPFTMKRFRLIEHTADIGLVAYGHDLAEAYANAAYGLFAIMTDLRKVRAVESRRVELKEKDAESLLFEWLNHLVYFFDAQQLLFRRFTIERFDGVSLAAVCHGERFDAARHEIKVGVKSATYHQLTVDTHKNCVRVIFDI